MTTEADNLSWLKTTSNSVISKKAYFYWLEELVGLYFLVEFVRCLAW